MFFHCKHVSLFLFFTVFSFSYLICILLSLKGSNYVQLTLSEEGIMLNALLDTVSPSSIWNSSPQEYLFSSIYLIVYLVICVHQCGLMNIIFYFRL